MVMDGAGFIHTDPPEDPDTIVGVAEIEARDDHRETRPGTIQLRLDPLTNDLLPEGSESLRIKSVSETKLGHNVTITEDGRGLIYDAGEDGLQSADTFYYIVESDDGKLGKANVNLFLEKERITKPIPLPRNEFRFFEDTTEQQLFVLRNDGEFSNGTIIAIELQSNYYTGPLEEPPAGNSLRIADDGKSLFYQPAKGFVGTEYYSYTVRNEDGQEAIGQVRINIIQPIRPLIFPNNQILLDFGTGDNLSPILYHQLAPTAELPHVESIEAPDYAGQFVISEDGKRLAYQPAEDFIGRFNLTYTVRYGIEDYQFITGSLSYQVDRAFLAVENWFSVVPNSGETELQVLENDPAWQRRVGYKWIPPVELSIAAVSNGDQGGRIRVSEDGKSVIYQPPTGFTGDETFTYEVFASNSARDTATVTVHVAEPVADLSGIDRFVNEAELEQFLIDKAVARYMQQFGLYETRYNSFPAGEIDPYVLFSTAAFDTDSLIRTQELNTDHSETNTQIAGIDEADIVETDGHYVYTFTNGELVIVDVSRFSRPKPVSFTEFEQRFDLMYLQGDRMTLLRNGSLYDGDAEMVVLDISDRSAPTVVERTEIDGHIADSRAIGDRVHLVVKRSFVVPELSGKWIIEPVPPEESTEQNSSAPAFDDHTITDRLASIDFGFTPIHYKRGEPGIWRYESLEEYLDRVRNSLIETGLPSFRSYDSDGDLVDSGFLTEATKVHKPVAGSDRLVSLVSFDAGDQEAGPLTAATSFVADANLEVFVSHQSAYVFAYDSQTSSSTIHKLDFQEDGSLPIVASSMIGGKLLNQFSADEYDGYFRVATTEIRSEEIETSRGTRRVQRQRFNNVLVLEQQGNQLAMVGEITNLAPTETIHSVRFMGERAYVVTFRLVDPLFALDMSDPTKPTVEGALKIPGFSNYLHPVGSDYLIGIGRDANEITGQRGPLQITLFNVSDLSNPHVADQLSFEGANWVTSEAWIEHHAISFFVESGVLAIPITWSEQIELDDESLGYNRLKAINKSAIWTFKVDVSNPDEPSIEATGSVEHEAPSYLRRIPLGWTTVESWLGGWTYNPGSPARRSLRVGETLITVSNEYVKINDLYDPNIELAEAYLGQLTQDDTFIIDEDSGRNTLRVRANDLKDPGGQKPHITGVTQPDEGGVVKISNNGKRLIFTLDEDFFGNVTFTYTTFDPVRGEETANVQVTVENVPDEPIAVDDEFSVEVDSDVIILDVLTNDINPDYRPYQPPMWNPIIGDHTHVHTNLVTTDLVLSSSIAFTEVVGYSFNRLSIAEVGETDQDGTVEIDQWGRLTYSPAEGFEGYEAFTYTIETSSGLTDVGIVTVKVGNPQEPEEAYAVKHTIYRPEQLSAFEAEQFEMQAENISQSYSQQSKSAVSATHPKDNGTEPLTSSPQDQERDLFTTAPETILAGLFNNSHYDHDLTSREQVLEQWISRWIESPAPIETWTAEYDSKVADSVFRSIGSNKSENAAAGLETTLLKDMLLSHLTNSQL